jgi:putative endonuclease
VSEGLLRKRISKLDIIALPKNARMKNYYVYIMTNLSRTLYTGVTNNLVRRVYEHKNKLIEGFTKKYNITRLVYFEVFNNIEGAIRREKQIKGWVRKKKIALIESINPEWKDLYEELIEEDSSFHSE